MPINTYAQLTTQERRAIFAALVACQDKGENVIGSRMKVARRFKLADPDVRRIEDEGLAREWPPLDGTTKGRRTTSPAAALLNPTVAGRMTEGKARGGAG
jgi:hypothetical protein